MNIYKQFLGYSELSINSEIFSLFMSQKKVEIKEDKDVSHYHINNQEGISECMINILGVIERARWNWT